MRISALALTLLASCLFIASPAKAESQIESVTFEGGPIMSKHIQSGDEDFRDHHTLGVVKVHTQDYGNWGLYVLTPNSVDRTSVGAGYVTDPYGFPVGPFDLEFSGALGLVTGYQDYPVPLLALEARLVFLKTGQWDAGLSMAALPYYMKDESDNADNEFGVVVTSPFLSARYKF